MIIGARRPMAHHPTWRDDDDDDDASAVDDPRCRPRSSVAGESLLLFVVPSEEDRHDDEHVRTCCEAPRDWDSPDLFVAAIGAVYSMTSYPPSAIRHRQVSITLSSHGSRTTAYTDLRWLSDFESLLLSGKFPSCTFPSLFIRTFSQW